MHLGKENPNNKYLLNNLLLPSVEQEVDLGVTFNSSWNWIDQINNCIGKANKCIAWVTRNVICRNADVMINIYKSLIRPHLEYCVQVWAPVPHYGNWKHILDIENVQRRYTRLIDGVGLKSYQERLRCLNLTTLLERRARGDLIETFKILNGIANYGENLFKRSTRGNNLLIRPNMYTKSQRGFLSSRVVGYWNKLPVTVKTPIEGKGEGITDHRVYQKNMVNIFKNRLDSYRKRNLDQPGHFWELSH